MNRTDGTMSTSEPTIRLAYPRDVARCNAFHNAYYGRSRSDDQWTWEFCRMTDSDGTIPFVMAEVDGEIVGTQAFIPVDLVDRSGPYLSAKSEETLVAPSMRGKNLFHRMYELLFTWAATHGVEYVWGFTPAKNAFEREGFACPVKTSQLFRSFSATAARRLRGAEPSSAAKSAAEAIASSALATYGNFAARLRLPASAGAIEIRLLDAAPEWADELSSTFVREWGGTSIYRSRQYLEWRLFQCPYMRPLVLAAFVDGTPVGYVAFGLGTDGIAAIVDLIAISPPTGHVDAATVVQRLIHEAADRSRDMGAVAIRAWHVTPHPFSLVVKRGARRLGWIHVERGFEVVVKPIGAARRPASWPFENWYVTRLFTEGTTA